MQQLLYICFMKKETQSEHLIKWLKKQKHLRPTYICEQSEMHKSMLSRLLTDITIPDEHHYKALLPICKKMGYVPIK